MVMKTHRTAPASGRVGALSLLAAAALVVGAPTAARADEPGDIGTMFQVDDKDPLKNLPTEEERERHPLEFGYYLQDLIARAEGGFEQKDWTKAVKYYEVLARLVPETALGFSRLCTAYAELGQIEIAAANCGQAVQLQGAVVYDHLRFVRLTLDKKKFTQRDVSDIEASLTHLRVNVPAAQPSAAAPQAAASGALPAGSAAAPAERSREEIKAEFTRRFSPGKPNEKPEPARPVPPPKPQLNLPLEIEVLTCRLAVRVADAKRLEACTDSLKRLNADERLVLPFAWSKAMIQRDEHGAQALLDRAKALKFPEPAMRAMTEEQSRAFTPPGWRGCMKRFALPMLIVGLTLLFVGVVWTLWSARRKRLAPAALSSPPSPASPL
jgi:hypothetical protein